MRHIGRKDMNPNRFTTISKLIRPMYLPKEVIQGGVELPG
ncbi:MAG: hypothetical protein OJF51_002224 [Nitrospira sp.]|nr:MAG: hypothetical protein OJF51_002224 [Nitrospira sp.]